MRATGWGTVAQSSTPTPALPRPVHPTDVRRLLFIRPRFLGDLCLTLPLVQAARAACPDARVAYVCERGLAPLLADDPCIDEVITVGV